MDTGIVVLRLVHILGGVYWAGTMLFVAFLLQPSVRDAGPAGGRVMAGLDRRRHFTILPVVAALTILSGIDLLRRASANFEPAWFGSATGATFTTGSVAALLAFIVGMTTMRPAALQAIRQGPAVAEMPEGPERAARLAELDGLRRRAAASARIVATLLLVAVFAMAIARYLG